MKGRKTFPAYTFHLFFLVLMAVFGWNAALGDWGNYYYGTELFSHLPGTNFSMQPYNTAYFNAYADAATHQSNFLSYSQVPPLSLVFYYPFTWLSAPVAKLVFNVISYLLCSFSVLLLSKKLKIDLQWIVWLPVLFLFSIKSNFEQGQTYFLIVALLGSGFLARANGKWILSAFLFALAVHLKIFPAIVLPWLLAEKDWKTFGATIAAVIILLIATLPVVDWELWKYYGTEILPRLAKGEITNTYATTYQSMQVFLKQLFVPDILHNPSAPVNSPFLFRWGNPAWVGLVLVVAFLFSFDKRQNSFFRFSIWLFAGMLTSGYGSVYGQILLIFPALAILAHDGLSLKRKIILLVLIGFICNFPVSDVLKFPFPFSFPRLFLSLILFAVMICFIRPRWNKFALVALLIPLLSIMNSGEQEQGSRYFLQKEHSLLNTDLRVSGDTIIYYARTKDSKEQYRELFSEHIATVKEYSSSSPHFVSWNEKEYHFPGEQITQLYVINNKYFLYLSDRNRGPGFTTLRIKEIGK